MCEGEGRRSRPLWTNADGQNGRERGPEQVMSPDVGTHQPERVPRDCRRSGPRYRTPLATTREQPSGPLPFTVRRGRYGPTGGASQADLRRRSLHAGPLKPGEAVSRTLEIPRTYRYICVYFCVSHEGPTMNDTIMIEAREERRS